jgi:hypothetical protein
MLDIRGLIIQHFVQELREAYQQTYNLMEPQFGNILEWTGRLALVRVAARPAARMSYSRR